MCWNFEISLFTGIFSWRAVYLLLQKPQSKNTKLYLYSLILFSSMQFVDAILWYINVERNNINYITTSFIIPSILFSQIVYNLLYYNKYYNNITYLILGFFFIYLFYRFNGYTSKTNCNNYCNLKWGDISIHYLEFIVFFLLITFPIKKISIDKTIYFLLILYFSNNGSVWCSIANLLSLEMLLKYY